MLGRNKKIVVKSEEVKTEVSKSQKYKILAEFSEENCGSKRAILPR
jgi:hypothetical protein